MTRPPRFFTFRAATTVAVTLAGTPVFAQSSGGTLTPPPPATNTAATPPAQPAAAGRTVALALTRPGNYTYWTVAPSGQGAVATMGPDQKTARVPLPNDAREIRVLSAADGTLALLPVTKAKSGQTITAAPQNFVYVRQLPVTVSGANNKPVRSAVVTLADAKGRRDQRVLTEAEAGRVAFDLVPMGKATLTAAYGTAAGGPKTTQSITVAPAPGGQIAPIALSLSGDVPTLDAPATRATPAAPAAAPAPIIVQMPAAPALKDDEAARRPSWIAGILGLALLAGGGVLGLRYARARGLTVPGALRKMGIEMPQDAAGDVAGSLKPANAAPILPPLPALNDLPAATAARGGGGQVVAPAGGFGPRLVGMAGSVAGKVVPVGDGVPVTLGRDAANTLALPGDTTASRRHARVEARPGGDFIVVDEGSSNGTFVNGARTTGEQSLRPGDEVQVGAARFRFEA